MRNSTVSFAFQLFPSDTYEPGVAFSGNVFPLTFTKNPRVAHPGTRTFRSNAPAPFTISFVVSAYGKSVTCWIEMPRSRQVSVDGTKRFTYSDLLSALRK